jgi:hypothetical protein
MTGSSAATSLRQKLDFCSTFSERSGEEPAGSAWAVRRHLLFELALPWPEYYMEAKGAPAGLPEMMEQVYKDLHYSEVPGLIAVAPDPAYAIPGKIRMFHYTLPDGQISGTYTCSAYAVDPDHLLDAIRSFIYSPSDSSLAQHQIPHDPATRDLLVCTHGTVDVCCATFGAPVYKLMRAMADQASSPVRVWRSTHFGGHRFAPTALDLPTGHYWGRLKADNVSGLIHRNRAAIDYRPLYRGSTSLSNVFWQRAEAELFAEAGWGWFDTRFTSVIGDPTEQDGGAVTFRFEHPTCGHGEVEITLKPNGTIDTRGATESPEIYAAPQFLAQKTREEPPGILARIARTSFVGPS